jgi:AraC-like DNA-binding protein
VRVGIFLPTSQAAQIRAAMETHDQVCVADSWEALETLVRLEPLSIVVFNPASDGTMDATRACRLIRNYASIPFVAYVPVDATFVRGIAQMANEGLQDVVVYRFDDSPSPLHKTLERVSSVPYVGTLVGMLDPWFRRLPPSLVDVLVDDLREPHMFASAEDIAAAADVTLSGLYRSFRSARLNSPKSFVVGARVFRGCAYLRDAGFSIGDVARKLGYAQPRIFARHIECVLGRCPSRLRHSLDDAEAVSRLVTWLGSATRSAGRWMKHNIVHVIYLVSVADWMGGLTQLLGLS